MSIPKSLYYTNTVRTSLPANGAAEYDRDINQNFKIIDFIIPHGNNYAVSGLVVTVDTGLDIDWTTGVIVVDGTEYTPGASSDTCTDNTVDTNLELANFVYVNSSGAVTVSTTLPTDNFVPLAIVHTHLGAITVVSDVRRLININGQAIKTYVDNTVISSVDYRGGYNATTNTPDLDTSPSGVSKGDMYTVTTAGTFFTTGVEIGDVIIAELDNATTEAEWTIVNKNLDAAGILVAIKTVDGSGSGLDADLLDAQEGSYYRNAGNLNAGILPAARFNDTAHGSRGSGTLHAAATDTTRGFVELATAAEAVTGTDTTKAVTPAGVAAAISAVSANMDYILLEDQKTQNTDGGAATSSTWHQRDITTEVSDTGGNVTISSNQFTLQAGTYSFEISCPMYRVAGHQARLYNVSDTSVVKYGTSEFANNGSNVQNRSFIKGSFTIASAKTFIVEHYATGGQSPDGLGTACNIAGEVYTQIELWKEI